MRFRFLLLAIFLSLLSGCAAKQQNINQDTPSINTNVVVEARQDGAFCLIKPADGPVHSDYGMRRHPTKKKKQKFHAGIDIAAKRGSDVVAAAPGTVVFSGRRNGYGKTVEIDHGNGLCTLYAHMDKVFVSKGQTLAQGERLGLVGRTGRTTGSHLHFELLADGKHTNPVPSQGWAESDLNIVTATGPAAASATVIVAEASASEELSAAASSRSVKPKRGNSKKRARPSSPVQAAKESPKKRPAS